jgi:hypothetical protein
MYSPFPPVATETSSQLRDSSLKPGSPLTILVQSLNLGGKLERLGVLAIDFVDKLAEEAPWGFKGRIL